VDHATLFGPEPLQGQNEILEKHRSLPVEVIGIVITPREGLSSQIIGKLRGYIARRSLLAQTPEPLPEAILDIFRDNGS
jgi:hypothetical protein